MDQPITWGLLITVVLFLLGVALLIAIIMAVANLIGILAKVRRILDETAVPLQKTLEQVKVITENTARITGQVNESMDDVQKLLGNVTKISDTAKATADTIRNDVVGKVKSLLGTADTVRKFFVRKEGASRRKAGSTVYRYTYSPGRDNPDTVEVEKPEGQPADERVAPNGVAYSAEAEKQEKK